MSSAIPLFFHYSRIKLVLPPNRLALRQDLSEEEGPAEKKMYQLKWGRATHLQAGDSYVEISHGARIVGHCFQFFGIATCERLLLQLGQRVKQCEISRVS